MELRKQAPTITAVCLTVLTILAIGGALFLLRPVLVPFVLAVFLSILASPLVDLLRERARFPQSLAIVTTVVLGLAVVVAISAVAASAIAELRQESGEYTRQWDLLRAKWIDPALQFLHLSESEQSPSLQDWVMPLVRSVLNELLSVASNGAVVLVYLFFLLASHSTIPPDANKAWTRVRTSIAQYISLKVLVSLITATLVWATLEFFGVPLALVFGLLTFSLNFIPNVGSLIAIVLPVPVILMNPDLGSTSKILAIAIPAVVQFTVGNIIEPRLMGNSLDLHPVVVLLSLIVWGWLWGIVGVLLAVPMTSAVKIVFETLGYTQPLAELLAGRPGSGNTSESP